MNETNIVSQTLKQDLEIVRNHQQINDTIFDYEQALNQCVVKSDEIQYDKKKKLFVCIYMLLMYIIGHDYHV
jgi:hypothetical protein